MLSCDAGHEKARMSGVAVVEACTAAGATRSWVSTSRTASATALPPLALEPISTRGAVPDAIGQVPMYRHLPHFRCETTVCALPLVVSTETFARFGRFETHGQRANTS